MSDQEIELMEYKHWLIDFCYLDDEERLNALALINPKYIEGE
jgi:hypothetical protein